ncbi:MAG: ABC transporter permease [Cyclobacteriaceae bacterium]|nr:ABC transporter permease [Cyclobacteriaceae bacterium]
MQTWTTILKPKTSLLSVPVRELWNYRDLLILFVRRDFVSFYKQTILGPLWFFIQPVFTTLVFMFVFGNLAGISTDGLPQPLFYLAGITAWNYFADCLTKTSTVFKDNVAIFGKVYFPRLITPLSIVVSNLVRFGVQLLLFFVVMAYYGWQGAAFQVQWQVIFVFPVVVLLMALMGFGLGLMITALTTKYRDLSFLLTFGVQLLMYGTTVIYPLSAAPASIKTIIQLHPMTGLIEAFRYSFLGRGEFTSASLGYSMVFTLVVTVLGVLVFNKTERSFIDTI